MQAMHPIIDVMFIMLKCRVLAIGQFGYVTVYRSLCALYLFPQEIITSTFEYIPCCLWTGSLWADHCQGVLETPALAWLERALASLWSHQWNPWCLSNLCCLPFYYNYYHYFIFSFMGYLPTSIDMIWIILLELVRFSKFKYWLNCQFLE